MIRIEDIITPERILTGLEAADKPAVLRQMTDALERLGAIRHSEDVHRMLLERESLMTTGVKRGFAFPHAFSKQFAASFLTLGVVPDGVPYEALDGEPVEFIFLLLGPPDNQATHLRILARISRMTSAGDLLDLLRAAPDRDTIMEVLLDAQRRLMHLG